MLNSDSNWLQPFFSRGTLLFLLLVHSLFLYICCFQNFTGQKQHFYNWGSLANQEFPGAAARNCGVSSRWSPGQSRGRSADRRSGEQVGQSTAAEPGRGNCWERRGQGLKKSVVSPWFHHGFTNRKDGKIKMLVLMFFVGETMWNHHFWCLLGINHHVFWCLSLSAALNGSILTIISIIEWV